jgi:hypothetical protein
MRKAHWIGVLVVLSPAAALAGRGSSAGAVASAIASGGYDAISTELERAEHLVCPSCVPMVRPLLDHQDRRVRQVAAWWLARRGLASELIETMGARLAGDDMVKARNAADVLGGLHHPEAVAPLSAALALGALDADTRAAAARALGEIGESTAKPALVRAFTASEAPVRAAAVAALRELRDTDDVSPAAALLGDGDEQVRIQAIYTIGAFRRRALTGAGASSITASLATIVRRDPSANVRKKAAWALGEIGAPASVAAAPLGEAARGDTDPLVRSIASAALGKLSR